MNEVFLFILAGVWLVFALVQDCKSREISNWLNYSLLAFALAYRAFMSIAINDYVFFLSGILGVAIFFVFANLFYYTKVFAGGDAKLLISLGAVIPYSGLDNVLSYSVGFLVLLFVLGAAYTLVYSIFIARRHFNSFYKLFNDYLRKYKWIWYASCIVAFFILLINDLLLNIVAGIIFILPPLFFYLKSIEKSCMIVYISSKNAREGDWIERNIKIGNKLVKSTIHGLTKEDLVLLHKVNKKILIRQGIPFAPAFVLAFIVMVYAYLSGWSWSSLVSLFL